MSEPSVRVKVDVVPDGFEVKFTVDREWGWKLLQQALGEVGIWLEHGHERDCGLLRGTHCTCSFDEDEDACTCDATGEDGCPLHYPVDEGDDESECLDCGMCDECVERTKNSYETMEETLARSEHPRDTSTPAPRQRETARKE